MPDNSFLRNFIRNLEVDNSSSDEEDGLKSENIQKAFYEIETYKEKRADIDANLLEYWEGKKYALPWLRRLALILHSVPATQVTVERAFSALKLLCTDLRYNLSAENLETLCVLKVNCKK